MRWIASFGISIQGGDLLAGVLLVVTQCFLLREQNLALIIEGDQPIEVDLKTLVFRTLANRFELRTDVLDIEHGTSLICGNGKPECIPRSMTIEDSRQSGPLSGRSESFGVSEGELDSLSPETAPFGQIGARPLQQALLQLTRSQQGGKQHFESSLGAPRAGALASEPVLSRRASAHIRQSSISAGLWPTVVGEPFPPNLLISIWIPRDHRLKGFRDLDCCSDLTTILQKESDRAGE